MIVRFEEWLMRVLARRKLKRMETALKWALYAGMVTPTEAREMGMEFAARYTL